MEKYKCTLDDASIKKAALELNEIPSERDSAVESLRQWVQQNSSWLKSPTDSRFLLGFLRNAKFVQLAARKRLTKYWTSRTQHPEWFSNVDTRANTIEECVKLGAFIYIPKRDKDGKGLFLGRTGSMDVSGKLSVHDMMRTGVAIMDYALMDEDIQVNGIVVFEDMSNLTLKHQTMLSPDVIRKSMNVWMKAYPMRYKGLHYYNVNPLFEALFAVVSPLLPGKLKKRLWFHGQSLVDVYKHIDKTCLTTDYLPDEHTGETIGSTQDCIDNNLKVLQSDEVRDYLLKLSGSEYGVVLNKKPKDEELFTESFRKLAVD